jgi:alkanesulfonate monooxygenase SsuD/methylene tetrahydromethanopterin reductase-like flavin-dependent oxidoreductase (luciferase family)
LGSRIRKEEKERGMNIGVAVTVREKVADVMSIARRAEALGFDSLWVPEHPIIPVHIPTSECQLNTQENTAKRRERYDSPTESTITNYLRQ